MEGSTQIKQNLITAYNLMAAERNTSSKEDWKVEQRDAFLAHMVSNHDGNLLEIGAGTGQDSVFFKEQGFDVTSVDLSPAMVSFCKEKGLTAYEMDFSDLQFPDKSFDAVWALNCLLHVPKDEIDAVLGEIKRVLCPGGLFYVGVYGGKNSEQVWEDDSYVPKRFFSFYDDENLKTLVSKYFEIVSFVTLPYSNDLNFQSLVLKN